MQTGNFKIIKRLNLELTKKEGENTPAFNEWYNKQWNSPATLTYIVNFGTSINPKDAIKVINKRIELAKSVENKEMLVTALDGAKECLKVIEDYQKLKGKCGVLSIAKCHTDINEELMKVVTGMNTNDFGGIEFLNKGWIFKLNSINSNVTIVFRMLRFYARMFTVNMPLQGEKDMSFRKPFTFELDKSNLKFVKFIDPISFTMGYDRGLLKSGEAKLYQLQNFEGKNVKVESLETMSTVAFFLYQYTNLVFKLEGDDAFEGLYEAIHRPYTHRYRVGVCITKLKDKKDILLYRESKKKTLTKPLDKVVENLEFTKYADVLKNAFKDTNDKNYLNFGPKGDKLDKLEETLKTRYNKIVNN